MKKRLLLLILIITLALSGCGLSIQPSAPVPPQRPDAPDHIDTPADDADDTDLSDTGSFVGRGESHGLELTAAVLIRRAILPGDVFPVSVAVANNGDNTIAYTLGSGSFAIPEALIFEMDSLQPILPKDRLGIATADYVVRELAPGESADYVVYAMAIEPDPDFDSHTFKLYADEGEYIADMEWSRLTEIIPGLIPAQPGPYSGTVRFYYILPDENGELNFFDSPAHFIQDEFLIAIG